MNVGLLLSGCEAAGGLLLLLIGGEVLLRGAVSLAFRFGLSQLLIGLTVVAAATSMPELVVVVTSGLTDHASLGIGNIVGSNIANTLLILGTAALLWPIGTHLRHVARDGAIGVGAAVLFVLFGLAGPMSWPHGAVMLLLLVGYVLHSYRSERGQGLTKVSEAAEREHPLPLIALLLLAGLAGLIVGSKLLVSGSIDIARGLGVTEAVIGLTLVAVGTSLPELATSLVAGYRRHSEVALGNILGSNLFNLLGILGCLALVTPFELEPELVLDSWIMVAVMALLLPVMWTGWRIGRREGLLFLLLYGSYLVLLYARSLGQPPQI